VGVGAYLGGRAKWAKKRAAEAAAWPAAEGTVTRSEVVEDPRPEDSSATQTYRAVVEYQFEVGGREYVGKRLGFIARHYYSADAAKETASRYPAGTTVAVHHDPGNPEDCVLEPGNLEGAKMYGILSWVIGAGGLLLIGAAVWLIRE